MRIATNDSQICFEKIQILGSSLFDANDGKEKCRQEADALKIENEELHSINNQLSNETSLCQSEVVELQYQDQG